ncbi:MAG TPA: hypothetical protein VNW90_21285 [Acetobacteraceae bacterium]|nr:hypothetical protein [Acetobacteraceae bacterium]
MSKVTIKPHRRICQPIAARTIALTYVSDKSSSRAAPLWNNASMTGRRTTPTPNASEVTNCLQDQLLYGEAVTVLTVTAPP